jgi:hypothetical protein
MKNPLKRRKYDKIIKDDIKVKVWHDDPKNFKIGYLHSVRSKNYTGGYPFCVWDGGKNGKENGFDLTKTTSYKHAELIEEEKEGRTKTTGTITIVPESIEFSNDGGKTFHQLGTIVNWKVTITEVQEFCDKYGVDCAMDSNKKWYWYKEKPEVYGQEWDGEGYSELPFQPDFDGDFRGTLHEPRGKKA